MSTELRKLLADFQTIASHLNILTIEMLCLRNKRNPNNYISAISLTVSFKLRNVEALIKILKKISKYLETM